MGKHSKKHRNDDEPVRKTFAGTNGNLIGRATVSKGSPCYVTVKGPHVATIHADDLSGLSLDRARGFQYQMAEGGWLPYTGFLDKTAGHWSPFNAAPSVARPFPLLVVDGEIVSYRITPDEPADDSHWYVRIMYTAQKTEEVEVYVPETPFAQPSTRRYKMRRDVIERITGEPLPPHKEESSK